MTRRAWKSRALGASVGALVVGGTIAVLRQHPAIQSGAIAPVLLLEVLIVARGWGIAPALAAAAVGSLGYSYFFLPPYGFGIENPNDWAAFVSFTVVAILGGELAARAERRQREAEAGRREIERLYQELQAAFDRASEIEAARRNEKLKAALLDALTHNLRTPLTAIKASVTALLGEDDRRSTGLSGEARLDLLRVIDEESDRLNRFVGGLSGADQLDPSQSPRVTSVPLAEIVQAGITRASTVTRHHRVEARLDAGIPNLAVDPAAVAEVIYILLDNASKYAPAGTTIRVTGSLGDEHHVRIGVADEGPGVPPELRDQVFEKFFRIEGREPFDMKRPRGIGLGLSIARRLVEAQAGQIWIDSGADDRGTTVMLTLPIAAEQREGAAERAEMAS